MVIFGHTIQINLLKYQIQINKRCGNCKSRKPLYKFLTGTHMSLESNADRLWWVHVHCDVWQCWSFSLNSCGCKLSITADIKFVFYVLNSTCTKWQQIEISKLSARKQQGQINRYDASLVIVAENYRSRYKICMFYALNSPYTKWQQNEISKLSARKQQQQFNTYDASLVIVGHELIQRFLFIIKNLTKGMRPNKDVTINRPDLQTFKFCINGNSKGCESQAWSPSQVKHDLALRVNQSKP